MYVEDHSSAVGKRRIHAVLQADAGCRYADDLNIINFWKDLGRTLSEDDVLLAQTITRRDSSFFLSEKLQAGQP